MDRLVNVDKLKFPYYKQSICDHSILHKTPHFAHIEANTSFSKSIFYPKFPFVCLPLIFH